MRLAPFDWTKPRGLADGQELALWMGFELWASTTGEWRVNTELPNGDRKLLVGERHQTPGKDIDEARQRAQAAAMVQHQLRHQKL